MVDRGPGHPGLWRRRCAHLYQSAPAAHRRNAGPCRGARPDRRGPHAAGGPAGQPLVGADR